MSLDNLIIEELKKTCGGMCCIDPKKCECFVEITDEEAIDSGIDINDKPDAMFSKDDCAYYDAISYKSKVIYKENEMFINNLADEYLKNDGIEPNELERLKKEAIIALNNGNEYTFGFIFAKALSNNDNINKDIESEYIYLLQSEHGTKIGKSINPQNRTNILCTKLPFEIKKTEIFKVENMSKTELFLHKKYNNNRLKGEWFDLSDDQLSYIRILLKQKNILRDALMKL